MKPSSIILPFLAASAQAFILSPTCVKAYHKAINKLDEWAQEAAAHVCHQGCVLTAETYHNTIRGEHLRPAVQRGLERHLARLDITEEELERLLQFADTYVETMLEQCPPAGTAQPERFDVCHDPEVFKQCAGKMKARLPGMCWKFKSLALAHSDEESCRDISAALDDPMISKRVEEKLDAYAAVCPVRE